MTSQDYEDQPDSAPAVDSMPGIDWGNDGMFFTYGWTDETSSFDDHHSVRFSGYGYTRKFKARVPLAFKDNQEMVDRFVSMMIDDFPGTSGFWVD